MKGECIIMVRETDLAFIRKAIEFLELSSDKHGVLPHVAIMRIRDIIEELESILEEEY